MMLYLILDGNPSSFDAESIWRKACQQSGHDLEVIKPDDSQYQGMLEQLKLNTFPALVMESRVLAVGIPTVETANQLLMGLAVSDTY